MFSRFLYTLLFCSPSIILVHSGAPLTEQTVDSLSDPGQCLPQGLAFQGCEVAEHVSDHGLFVGAAWGLPFRASDPDAESNEVRATQAIDDRFDSLVPGWASSLPNMDFAPGQVKGVRVELGDQFASAMGVSNSG